MGSASSQTVHTQKRDGSNSRGMHAHCPSESAALRGARAGKPNHSLFSVLCLQAGALYLGIYLASKKKSDAWRMRFHTTIPATTLVRARRFSPDQVRSAAQAHTFDVEKLDHDDVLCRDKRLLSKTADSRIAICHGYTACFMRVLVQSVVPYPTELGRSEVRLPFARAREGAARASNKPQGTRSPIIFEERALLPGLWKVNSLSV